jgi:CubicO group peptidase (beta-lactamase class C family)
MQINAAARLATTEVQAADYRKLREIAAEFEAQLKKSGAPGVEVTFIRDDEININTQDKRAFEKAKQVLKKVPGLKFKNEEVDDDPDYDAPYYNAWYKF